MHYTWNNLLNHVKETVPLLENAELKHSGKCRTIKTGDTVSFFDWGFGIRHKGKIQLIGKLPMGTRVWLDCGKTCFIEDIDFY